MKRRTLFITVGALLTACAGPRKDIPSDARIVAPPAWRAATPTPTTTVALNWWEAFGDPVLNILVGEALAHGDDIALAAASVEEARAQLSNAEAQRMPNVGLALEGGRKRDVNPGFGIPDEQTAWQSLIQASYDVDMFGRLRAGSAAARAALLATADAQQTVRLALTTTVVSSYLTLQALDARLRIVEQTLQVRRDELDVEQQRYDAGYSTALDVARAQAELEGTAQLLPALQLSATKAENALSILSGHAPAPIARSTAFNQLSLPEVPVALPSALLRKRPDIAAAEARLAATDHALDAARAAFLPDIRLAASAGYVGSTLVDASPVAVWSLGSSILTPLFDAGRLQSQQDAATARRDQAAYSYRKTVLQAFREVEDNLAGTAKYREQYASLTRQRDALARAYALAAGRYREGYATYLDQLDAQRNLLTAELSLVQSRLDRFNAVVNLIQALGGGWDADAKPAQAPGAR